MCIRKGTKEKCGDDAADYQVTLFEAMLAPTLEEAGCNIGKFDSRFYIPFRTNRFYPPYLSIDVSIGHFLFQMFNYALNVFRK